MRINARFTRAGVPQSSSVTPIIYIMKESDDSIVVDGAAMTKVGSGVTCKYEYDYTPTSGEEYAYICDGGSETLDSRYMTGDIDTDLERALGLAQENYYMDQGVFSSGKLTSARIRTYTSGASVGTSEGVLATYTITATYSGSTIETYQVVRS